jgi:hypothetical protein
MAAEFRNTNGDRSQTNAFLLFEFRPQTASASFFPGQPSAVPLILPIETGRLADPTGSRKVIPEVTEIPSSLSAGLADQAKILQMWKRQHR